MSERNREAKLRVKERAAIFSEVRRADPKVQVRSAMIKLGVSMSDLAEITGVEKKRLDKWIGSPDYDLRISELYLLADALNLSLTVMLQEVE